MIIKALVINALEAALNRYLALDDNRGVFLTPLAGKVIAVTVEPFAETFYLCPTQDAIQILDDYPQAADTHLTGSLLALGLMGVSSKPARSLFSGQVKIEGDVHTRHQFQELFAKLDINLQQQLERLPGGTITHNLAELFLSGLHSGQNWTQSWIKESLETFKLNLAEFLQEETRELPAAAEMDRFCTQVDGLRMDFDRLQSRVERLQDCLSSGLSSDLSPDLSDISV